MFRRIELYSYLNLESTKTGAQKTMFEVLLYSYLNLESTKTYDKLKAIGVLLYSYLNLESTKTKPIFQRFWRGCTVT